MVQIHKPLQIRPSVPYIPEGRIGAVHTDSPMQMRPSVPYGKIN